MKKRILFYFFFIFLFLLLQTTLLQYAEIYGVKPNIIIVFIVVTALLRGGAEGGAVGFFAGLALDMMFGGVLGFHALLGLYLGIAAGSVNKNLFRENMLVVIFFTFVFSIAYESLVFIINNIMSGDIKLLYAFTSVILPEAVYNSVMVAFILPLLIRADRWFKGSVKQARKY
ncbi:MAG: rod shape-determining protein MreD [Bacillota bacterium]